MPIVVLSRLHESLKLVSLIVAVTRADLIEYAYGDSTTTWGKTRIADGHPDPYKFRYIELGNEQVGARACMCNLYHVDCCASYIA